MGIDTKSAATAEAGKPTRAESREADLAILAESVIKNSRVLLDDDTGEILRTGTTGDSGDTSLLAEAQAVAAELSIINAQQQADRAWALLAIRDRAYGKCRICLGLGLGADIPLQRMRAVPTATLCITHKTEAEKAGTLNTAPDYTALANVPQNSGGTAYTSTDTVAK